MPRLAFLLLAVVITLSSRQRCLASTDFQLTNIQVDRRAVTTDFGPWVASVAFEAIAADGTLLAFDNISSNTGGSFSRLTEQIAFLGEDSPVPTFPTNDGIIVTMSDPKNISIDGAELEGAKVNGIFEILGQGVIGDGLPVSFNLQYDIFENQSATTPLYSVVGSGMGTADITAALTPDNQPGGSTQVLLGNTGDYTLSVIASPKAVPEPGSLAVWSMLLVSIIGMKRLRRA